MKYRSKLIPDCIGIDIEWSASIRERPCECDIVLQGRAFLSCEQQALWQKKKISKSLSRAIFEKFAEILKCDAFCRWIPRDVKYIAEINLFLYQNRDKIRAF